MTGPWLPWAPPPLPKLANQDPIQALRALSSPNEFTLVEPFTYSSGSTMGDFTAGRNHASRTPTITGSSPDTCPADPAIEQLDALGYRVTLDKVA